MTGLITRWAIESDETIQIWCDQVIDRALPHNGSTAPFFGALIFRPPRWREVIGRLNDIKDDGWTGSTRIWGFLAGADVEVPNWVAFGSIVSSGSSLLPRDGEYILDSLLAHSTPVELANRVAQLPRCIDLACLAEFRRRSITSPAFEAAIPWGALVSSSSLRTWGLYIPQLTEVDHHTLLTAIEGRDPTHEDVPGLTLMANVVPSATVKIRALELATVRCDTEEVAKARADELTTVRVNYMVTHSLTGPNAHLRGLAIGALADRWDAINTALATVQEERPLSPREASIRDQLVCLVGEIIATGLTTSSDTSRLGAIVTDGSTATDRFGEVVLEVATQLAAQSKSLSF